jgi:hypothetical membrane protein
MRIRPRRSGILRSYPGIGPICYASGFQYFVVQLLVALRWSPPYSVSGNTISDLGNTACGAWNGRYVCSPSHDLMNWSFIVLGVTMMSGSVFIFRDLAQGRAAAAGLAGMTAAGLGTVMVGLFPENSVPALHGAGAALPFVLGNSALLVLAFALEMPVLLRVYAFLSGAVAIIALVAYTSKHYLGLGQGGMERFVAYPQTIFLVAIGCYLIAKNPPGRGRRRP